MRKVGLQLGAGLWVLAIGAGVAGASGVVETSAGTMQITPVAEGLVEPWAIGFLPDGAFLVTERDGQLKHFTAPLADPQLVTGLPEIEVDGQGGLLDVLIPQDFATTREVWLTYAKPQGGGSGTAIGKGTLSADGTALEGFTQLFEMPAGSSGGRHFGARMVEAADGTIFLTLGDRGTGPEGLQAQEMAVAEGKIIHLTRDGSPATGLSGALPGLFSLGHRNPQGATLDLEAACWSSNTARKAGMS